MNDPRATPQRALVSCAVWLLAGFIGAAAVGAGLNHLFDGQTNDLSALPLVVLGAIAAVTCWRRAGVVIGQAAPDESPVECHAEARRREDGAAAATALRGSVVIESEARQ